MKCKYYCVIVSSGYGHSIFSGERAHNVPLFLIRYLGRAVCGLGGRIISHILCVQYKSARLTQKPPSVFSKGTTVTLLRSPSSRQR